MEIRIPSLHGSLLVSGVSPILCSVTWRSFVHGMYGRRNSSRSPPMGSSVTDVMPFDASFDEPQAADAAFLQVRGDVDHGVAECEGPSSLTKLGLGALINLWCARALGKFSDGLGPRSLRCLEHNVAAGPAVVAVDVAATGAALPSLIASDDGAMPLVPELSVRINSRRTKRPLGCRNSRFNNRRCAAHGNLQGCLNLQESGLSCRADSGLAIGASGRARAWKRP